MDNKCPYFENDLVVNVERIREIHESGDFEALAMCAQKIAREARLITAYRARMNKCNELTC